MSFDLYKIDIHAQTSLCQSQGRVMRPTTQVNKTGVYTMEYSYNQWNYFQGGCMDKWQSGDFSIQTLCIPLEAFASKYLFTDILLVCSKLPQIIIVSQCCLIYKTFWLTTVTWHTNNQEPLIIFQPKLAKTTLERFINKWICIPMNK